MEKLEGTPTPLVITTGVVAGLVLALIAGWWSSRDKSALPGPPSHPLLGNTLEVGKNLHRLLDWWCDNNRTYGGKDGLNTWKFTVAGQPTFVITSNPKNVERILTETDIYGKGPIWRRNFWRLLGDGIFSADGHNWYFQRKTASNMFKVANFKGIMHRTVKTKADKLLDILEKHVAATPGKEVVIGDLFFRFTLDSIGEIAFGQDLGSLSGRNEHFMQAFDYSQRYCSDLFFFPGPPYPYIFFTSDGWRFIRETHFLDRFSKELIRNAMAELDGEVKHEEERDDNLLLLFMQKSRDQNKPCDEQYLKDVILNAIIAGRDTTGQALSWMTYLLSIHPEVQEKVYEEAVAVLGDLTTSAITYDHIQRLNYTHAVMMETLRLYPSVPKEAKYSYKDDVLPDGTKISKGQWVAFIPYVMGRTEAIWPNPLEFNPERFLSSSKPSPFVFTAFQGGARICLGMNLAYLEGKHVIASIVRRYRFKLAPGHTVEAVQNSTTLPMKEYLRVILEPR